MGRDSLARRLLAASHRWLAPVVDPLQAARGLRSYAWFLRDLRRYRRMEGAERVSLLDAWPMLHERTAQSPILDHYFHQDHWALSRIHEAKPALHVDVGSRVDTVAHIAAFTRVLYVDLRPLPAGLEGLEGLAGDLLALPFRDASLASLSCLHVAEHVGLGRYGDPLDPRGTEKACGELARVLAPGGSLYFSVPVGRPRVEFNAHRVHAPSQVLAYFRGLELAEFSAVLDREGGRPGAFVRRADPGSLEGARYACGLFLLRKPRR